VSNETPPKKSSDLKILLGFVLLMVGIISMVQGKLGRFAIPGGFLWVLAGALLLLNGMGVIPRKKR